MTSDADCSPPSPTSDLEPSSSTELDPDSVPIVAIGASAGGLQALEAFFESLPTDTGMAFVVIMHLSPEHESNLSEILQHCTELSVRRIEAGTTPEPDTVYVLPPETDLGIEDGRLRVTGASSPESPPTVIDTFFRALAADQGENAVGVVLSGTGTDGTQGVKAIKEAGGFAMAQRPEEAAYDGMPRSAVATGLIDVVASAEQLAAELIGFWTHSHSTPPLADGEATEEEETLQKILTQVYAETGRDFSNYKRSTLLRRLDRRLTVTQCADLDDYLDRLRRDPEELEALLRELLICVTHFFRDPEAFAALEQTVVPELFRGKDVEDQVRVWSAGCATGEEAYSLAMLLREHAEQRDRAPDLQVFATDLSTEALETAREGLYPESVVSDLSAERVERHLVPEGSHYRVRQELREMVLFAEHDLLEDPPFSRLDLVSCRNLLIYLNREIQEHVFDVLHYALRPEGYLFLGASESIGAADGLFAAVDKQHGLYQRQSRPREKKRVPLFPLQNRRGVLKDLDRPTQPEPPSTTSISELHRQLLVEEAASLLVDENYEIVHLTEAAGRYLEFQGGIPTNNVLEVAPEKLRMELRGALYQAFENEAETEQRQVRTEVQGETRWLTLRVRPVEEGQTLAQVVIAEVEPPQAEDPLDGDTEDLSTYAAQLEEELRRTKQQLQTTVEEYETTTEELEASNEELLSMNEELQSKNEEIETSKEELQSVNEELNTTNQELKNKIEELRRSNSDLQNLMEATDVATLFLDRELQIRRFTPRVRELFNLRTTDIGRPLTDFNQKFEFDHLIDEARTVLDTLEPVEEELQNEEGRWFMTRLRPYRTVDDRIDGVVMTFVDITDRKEAHRETEREREYAESIVNTVREPLLVLDEDLCVQSANDAFHETFEVAPEIRGRHIYELGNEQWDIPELRALLEEVVSENAVVSDVEVDRHFDGLGRRVMRLNAQRIDEKELILLAIEDVTDLRRAIHRMREERNFVDSVLDTVGALVVVLDAEDRIIRFNEECETVTGYSSEEVEGEDVVDLLVPPEEQDEVRDMLAELRHGGAPVHHENRWRTQEGKPRLIRWSNTVLRDDEGEVEYVIGTGIDVTERRQLEREVIAASEEERRRIGEDLHDMLASHLAGTAMMADGIADKLSNEKPVTAEEVRKVASLVREAGSQARSLSHSLLPLGMKEEDLADGLQALADRQEDMRAFTCSFEKSADVPPVTGEVALHFYRIASEGVHNARTHADPDAVEIRLEVVDDHLVLTVRDDGVGIPENVEPTDGVGLHVMQYRADLIGARLDIEQAEEGGTRVRCRVPLEKVL